EGADGDTLAAIFWRLLDLPDAAVMDAVAVVMGESLAAGSAAVEAVGLHIGLDMADWWQADPAFFELARDREVRGALVAEVAGEAVASANAREKGKTLKRIVAGCLAGENGRRRQPRRAAEWSASTPAHPT